GHRGCHAHAAVGADVLGDHGGGRPGVDREDGRARTRIEDVEQELDALDAGPFGHSTLRSVRFLRPPVISGSCCRSRYSDTHRPIITRRKGAAAMIVIVCRALSASSPPLHSSRAATPPVSPPQKITTPRFGARVPRWLRLPITIDAESAPEMKKMAMRSIATTVAIPVSGRFPSTPNSCPSTLSAPAMSYPSSCCPMPAPPKIENQMRLTRLGTRMTPMMNSRMVRPRLMRARNMPTKGAHETHHAQ